MRTLLLSLALLPSMVLADEAGLLILFGAKDTQPTAWDGRIELSEGKVGEISGWRFGKGDTVQPKRNGWLVSTHRKVVRQRSNNARKLGMAKRQVQGPMDDNGVIVRLQNVTEATQIQVTTKQGNFSFSLDQIPYGTALPLLDGGVVVQRTAAGRALTTSRSDDDFPCLAGDPSRVFVTWQSFTPGLDRDERAQPLTEAPADFSFLAKPTGGDQLWVSRRQGRGEWDEPVAVTETGRDLFRSSVTPDGQGGAWVVWSEQEKGNFDVFARHWDKAGQLGERIALTSDGGNDLAPVAATDAKGQVWVAWMGAREGRFVILTRTLKGGTWSPEFPASEHAANSWNPVIAANPLGGIAVAWDTYDKGDYDIWMRTWDAEGKAAAPQPVANSYLYETRATLTYDATGALWLAWEKSGPVWGKDWGAYDGADGIGLYRDRQIVVRVWKDGSWMQPEGDIGAALPGRMAFDASRLGRINAPDTSVSYDPESGAYLDPAQRKGQPGKHAEAANWGVFNNLGRIMAGTDGRIWCLVRAKQDQSRGPVGSTWVSAAAYLEGDHWVGPILVPHSENLIYNLPALLPGKFGLLVAHATDHRMDRMAEFNEARLSGAPGATLNATKDPFDNDIYVSRITHPATPAQPIALAPATEVPLDNPPPSRRTIAEREEVTRIRDYRTEPVGGSPLRIVRGEFHRHTEISMDGGGDGPLEDMWRYAADAAAMDWLGNGDHDHGNGREYPWWLTQKTTDAYHIPGSFTPMFSYERSVSYPEGHRNVVFAQRGVRTLPRLPISDPKVFAPAPDTEMLYRYLHHFGGVCASHTSVGTMGTDWRNSDPEVEPMVEVYQGARQNYEYPGCPRCPTKEDAIGGWEPAGFICNAFEKGIKFSFQSSSDHGSTHISYAMIFVEDFSREGILKAMKLRRTYGATDNIIADTRCQGADGTNHMMGEAFTTQGAPAIHIKLTGTAPFKRIVIIKDNVEVHTTEPGTAEVDFTWTDPTPNPGKESYYYVRGEQTNDELVWASPMWITVQ
ncbi:MAG: DUF3604 domain-containing protein [Verrucomicrobiales bacterium]|nr:DUF3604 domain-containing protein [Verrucomicrobiales bacterium]